MNQNFAAALRGGLPPLPPRPTRAQVCQIRSGMQGLQVFIPSLGKTIFYFPSLIGWLPLKSDRYAVYRQLRAAFVTHVTVDLSGQYQVADYSAIPGRDWSSDLPGLHALCREIICQGFYVLLKLAGDGQSVKGPDGRYTYNDPFGLTYGYDWLMDNLDRVVSALRDLEPWRIDSPGYDGVFGPDGYPAQWTREQLHAYLDKRRTLSPACYMDLQFAIPYISDGDGGGFYAGPYGQMLDSVTLEWNYPALTPGDPLNRFCQNSARMLGAAFIPLYGCQPGPGYLDSGTPRGPIYTGHYEGCTYWGIRGYATIAEQLDNERTYASVGWQDCLPYPVVAYVITG